MWRTYLAVARRMMLNRKIRMMKSKAAGVRDLMSFISCTDSIRAQAYLTHAFALCRPDKRSHSLFHHTVQDLLVLRAADSASSP